MLYALYMKYLQIIISLVMLNLVVNPLLGKIQDLSKDISSIECSVVQKPN